MPAHEDCLLRKVFEFLRPFVWGTPTTHSEGLLLRIGALPCAPTYNRGVVQQDFLTGWGYQKILLENVLLEKAFSDDSIRSGFLVPYQKSRFLITFSNSIRSGLISNIIPGITIESIVP